MGLQIEFYAGDAATIGAIFAGDDDWDGIRGGSQAIAYADLSLHIGVEHLDTLSTVIAEQTQQEPRMLLDCLGANVGTMEDDGGSAEVVDPAWVAMVAALEPAAAAGVAATWIRRVGEESGEELEPTDDAADAVASLVALCRKAIAARADVVNVWYL